MLMNQRFKLFSLSWKKNPDGTKPKKPKREEIGTYSGRWRGIDETEIAYNEILKGKNEPLRLITYQNIDLDKEVEINGQPYSIIKKNISRKPYSYLLAKRSE